jgi:hypothetical protein
MQFLLDQAAGRQPETGDVGVTVLSGSRISCEASSQHRALAAFLWRGELIAARPQIRVIADQPDQTLREACAIIDRYALHADGFGVPYGRPADDAYRARLIALAHGLTECPLSRRYGQLGDLEHALAGERDDSVTSTKATPSRWWRR